MTSEAPNGFAVFINPRTQYCGDERRKSQNKFFTDVTSAFQEYFGTLGIRPDYAASKLFWDYETTLGCDFSMTLVYETEDQLTDGNIERILLAAVDAYDKRKETLLTLYPEYISYTTPPFTHFRPLVPDTTRTGLFKTNELVSLKEWFQSANKYQSKRFTKKPYDSEWQEVFGQK